MSNWISITADDLNDAKVAPLVDALRSAALGTDQTDPAPRIIEDVVLRIRAEVKGCASNLVDADTTKIPGELKSLAMRMIVRQMQSRLQLLLNDDEREEQRNDLRYLQRIASCEVPIASPDNPIEGETQEVSGTPRITPRCRQFTRRQQEGL